MSCIKGRVIKGLGKGQYFVSREGYRRQFQKKLDFDPAPGTLNLEIDGPFCEESSECIKIEGFEDEEGNFGRCKCYKVMIGDIKGAIVRPDRTNYSKDRLEIIAPLNLRKALNLKDGDELELILEEQDDIIKNP